ncbi:hypothetical protein PLESTB_000425800 [Pleodorina starrii]|uniref:Uncharacterized protein n=1 Tax=Pleodorina starrii TaxID=330485 RepID=A0A9W6F029_9CHLO|nr:hypothetical protein PLESTM_001698300 [Pleodorina starrii]GLC50731.1 hypothetical protein PLESTB_000425800 [Pleodorina starrii]GLC74364.1 hypothetical protein PLESTF_001503800 [Pleodorina starrii]
MNTLPQRKLGSTLQQTWPKSRPLIARVPRSSGQVLQPLKGPCIQRSSTGPVHGRSLKCNSTEAAVEAVAPCCKAAAASAAAATAAPVAATLPEAVIYTVVASTAYTALCFIAMALFPRKSAGFFSSVWPFIPLSLAYLALLVFSWSPDTLQIMMPGSLKEGLSGGFNPQFFPRLEGISALFGRLGVTASWVVHVLVINLFAGRWCLLEGLRHGIPTAHSVLLCSVFGPLGLLAHCATKALSTVVPALKAEEEAVTLKSEQGTITILPYSSEPSSS